MSAGRVELQSLLHFDGEWAELVDREEGFICCQL
jgi:hypothetical protein